MRDLLKRIDRLEQQTPQPMTLRIVRQIIQACDGRALPFNPTQAKPRGSPEESAIRREPSESPEDFQTRALACWPDAQALTVR